MDVTVFGHSSQNIPILSYDFASSGPAVLILGAVHGDEIEGAILAQGLIGKILSEKLNLKLNLKIIPQMNIEGVLYKTRGNFQGVDLNRNLPTKDWSPEVKTPRYHPGPSALSESENKALVNCIENFQPTFILSLHSWHPMINVNGDCMKQAEILHALTGYRIDADMGYPTPGCLGTFTGIERNIPTITYEIERGLGAEAILKTHVPAILNLLTSLEK